MVSSSGILHIDDVRTFSLKDGFLKVSDAVRESNDSD